MRAVLLLLIPAVAAADPAFVPEKAVVVGRVDNGAWTDAATEARSDQKAELAAVVMEERFEALDAPVMRVTYPDTHPPFSQVLEQYNLPNAEKILAGIRRLSAY